MVDDRNRYLEMDIRKIKHKAEPGLSQEALKEDINIQWTKDILNEKKQDIAVEKLSPDGGKFLVSFEYKDIQMNESEMVSDEYIEVNICVPPDLHMQAVFAAIDRRISLDEFVEDAIRRYLESEEESP